MSLHVDPVVCLLGWAPVGRTPHLPPPPPPKKREKNSIVMGRCLTKETCGHFIAVRILSSCTAAAGGAGRRPWALILSRVDTCCPAAATNKWLVLTFAHTCPRPHHLFSPLLCPHHISRAAFTCLFISLAWLKLMHEHQQCRTLSTRADRMKSVCKIFQ